MNYKYLLIYVLLFNFAACKSLVNNNDTFAFKPELNKDYHYLISKQTSEQWHFNNVDNVIYDSADIDITLRCIANNDSRYTCKLIFNDYNLKRHPFTATFNNTGNFRPVKFVNPFAVLDSLGKYVHDTFLKVEINKEGIVDNVSGIDDLLALVSSKANTDKLSAERQLGDYISTNAVRDLLNPFFSIAPGKKIKDEDMWSSHFTLVTLAPVKVSSNYLLKNINGDELRLEISSTTFSQHCEGDPVPLKGKANGTAVYSYKSGMPEFYNNNAETITKTTSYDVIEKMHLMLKEY
ncbi:MAG: DUF6263 family protein [Ginsengibacter sp.]